MQYLVSVIYDTADLATPDEMTAIDAFNDRLIAEGHWVFAGGLGAPLAGGLYPCYEDLCPDPTPPGGFLSRTGFVEDLLRPPGAPSRARRYRPTTVV